MRWRRGSRDLGWGIGWIRLPILGHQVGALAWLPETDPVRFALVTTRRTERWVFPKGWVDPGVAPPEAAAREAFEEAGVRGTVDPVAVGTFRTAKVRPPFAWPLEITLYPLRIERVLDRWPEAGQRQRRFVTLAEVRHEDSAPLWPMLRQPR